MTKFSGKPLICPNLRPQARITTCTGHWPKAPKFFFAKGTWLYVGLTWTRGDRPRITWLLQTTMKSFSKGFLKYFICGCWGFGNGWKFILLSEMKICWHKRKVKTLWEVCVSFIIVLKQPQTCQRIGVKHCSPLFPNWIGCDTFQIVSFLCQENTIFSVMNS